MRHFWIPALAFALLQGLGMGLFSVFGFFLKPLAETFQAKEAMIASGLSLLVLVPALAGALVGKLVDRTPKRQLLLTGAWIAMCFLLLLPLAQHTWQLGLLFLGFVVGIVLYGPQATNVFIIRCYPQHQGRALAMAAVGVSVASIVLPPLTAVLMANLSWQRTLQCLALLILCLLTLAICYGVPKGRGNDGATSSGAVDFSDPSVRAALRSRPFWCVGFGFAILQSLMTVSSLCFVPHFMLMGLSAEAAGSLIAMGGAAGLMGKLCMAGLADKLRQRVPLLCMGLSLLQIVGWSLFLVVTVTGGSQSRQAWSVSVGALVSLCSPLPTASISRRVFLVVSMAYRWPSICHSG